MKFILTFKTPDVEDQIENIKDIPSVQAILNKFLEYDEYIEIEFDEETQTARVIPQSEQ